VVSEKIGCFPPLFQWFGTLIMLWITIKDLDKGPSNESLLNNSKFILWGVFSVRHRNSVSLFLYET
jgi:hypothetical protein